MAQEEVLELLEKEAKPLSAREIALKLNLNDKRVLVAIKKLIIHNEIKFKELSWEEARMIYDYKVKRRMRIYFVDGIIC